MKPRIKYIDAKTRMKIQNKNENNIEQIKINCNYPNCSYTFNTYEEFATHIKSHNNPNLICPYENCNKRFKALSRLIRHLFAHTRQRIHKCPLCSTKFTLKYNMKAHYRKHFIEKKKKNIIKRGKVEINENEEKEELDDTIIKDNEEYEESFKELNKTKNDKIESCKLNKKKNYYKNRASKKSSKEKKIIQKTKTSISDCNNEKLENDLLHSVKEDNNDSFLNDIIMITNLDKASSTLNNNL